MPSSSSPRQDPYSTKPSRHSPGLEEYTPAGTLDPRSYEVFLGRERIEELERLAAPLRGFRWVHINSAFDGGGVAEMLRSLVPLSRALGLDTRWYRIDGGEEFFSVTKRFHNTLQGLSQPLTEQDLFRGYLDTIEENAARAGRIRADLFVVHDPQPCALVNSGVLEGNILWRCHIDTSTPDPIVWRFLLPYINQTSGAIFTLPRFVGGGIHVPLYQVAPCIDPLAVKNQTCTETEAAGRLEGLFRRDGIDPRRPILAAVSRYDPHKNQATILEAFHLLKKTVSSGPKPYLVFLGNTASDDPEGGAMLERLREQAGGDPDVRFWVNVEDNDRVVGALMRLARGFVHISTKEGFGLVVSEALWQGTPVIGSNAGGIGSQVLDGRTGYRVDPMDVETIADRMRRILERPEEARRLGLQGREHVRANFLLPELLRRHLLLLRYYTGVDASPPAFRLNGKTHSEVIHEHYSRRLFEPGTTLPAGEGLAAAP